MRSITVTITPDAEEQVVIASLEERLRALGVLNAADSLLVEEAKNTIRDFVARAHREYAAGTTIQLGKNFRLSRATLSIKLDYPGKQTLLRKLLNRLRSK
jgi:hypothetical protein